MAVCRHTERSGFTLIEIIAVLIIIGVLGAVAAGRFSSLDIKSRGEVDLVKNQIRYAHHLAMRRGELWGVRSTGSDYHLFKEDPSASYPFPGEKSSLIPDSFTVSFNRWGQPVDYSSGALLGDVPVSMGGVSFSISAETGFIP